MKFRSTVGWYRAFQNLTEEHGFEPATTVTGEIPKDLNGRLYRVGSGQFSLFGKQLPHWFDGDGAISATELKEGQASYAAKMVVSQGGIAEKAAGQTFLGSYGIAAKTFRQRLNAQFRNPANTSIFCWNKRVFALWEAGLPTELSSSDLTTLGETDLGGVIKKTFSAHPKYVPSRNAHYNFGVTYGPVSRINLYELKDSGSASTLGSFAFRGSSFIHDFIATDNYLVLIAAPVFVRVFDMIFKSVPISEAMYWNEKSGSEIFVIPIDNPKAYWKIKEKSFLPIHFFNGFEKGDQIIMDSISYSDLSTVDRLKQITQGLMIPAKHGKVVRKTIDLKSRTLDFSEISALVCEFPQVSPDFASKEYQWGYALSYSSADLADRTYFDSVSKINMSTGMIKTLEFGPDHYPSEPVFVPKSNSQGEDDGYLLTVVYDSILHRNYLAILDALDLRFVSKVELQGFSPLTFHGAWAPM